METSLLEAKYGFTKDSPLLVIGVHDFGKEIVLRKVFRM